MTDSKVIGLFLIVLALFGMWLNSRNQLVMTLDTIAHPSTVSTPGISTLTLAEFGSAIVVYLLVLSFLTPGEGFGLTLVLVLGGLLYNERTQGTNSISHQLLGKPTNVLEDSNALPYTGGYVGPWTGSPYAKQ